MAAIIIVIEGVQVEEENDELSHFFSHKHLAFSTCLTNQYFLCVCYGEE